MACCPCIDAGLDNADYFKVAFIFIKFRYLLFTFECKRLTIKWNERTKFSAFYKYFVPNTELSYLL